MPIDKPTLMDYVRVLVRRWWLVLIPLIAMGAATLASYRPASSTFQVTLRFAAGLPPEKTPGVYNYDRQYVWLASEYTANALSDIVHTDLFAQNVANRLASQGLTVASGQLQGAVASDQKQSVVYVYLTWPDANQIVRIGDAIISELVEHGASYWPQLTAPAASPVVALDRPAPVAVAVSLRDRFDIPVRLLLALAAGLALAFVAHAVDPQLRERRELERIGIAVIGTIPKVRQQ